MEKIVLDVNENGEEITIRDVQNVILEILKEIDRICTKHNIQYFLTGGTCLGAVRHKGFIPWDDDGDIAMMRKDYERFQKVVQEELKEDYVAQCFDTHEKYRVIIPPMKIRKKGTYVEEKGAIIKNLCEDSEGIFVDIFVYDYLSNRKRDDLPMRLRQYTLMPLLLGLENIKLNPKKLKKLYVDNAKKYSSRFQNSDYIGYDMTWQFNSPLKPVICHKDVIFPLQYVRFEDTYLPIPNKPHDLLDIEISKSHMQLPPKIFRKPKHIKKIKL